MQRIKNRDSEPLIVHDWKRTATECRCLDKTAKVVGACAVVAATALYYILSEGSRIVFPPRNLVPVP